MKRKATALSPAPLLPYHTVYSLDIELMRLCNYAIMRLCDNIPSETNYKKFTYSEHAGQRLQTTAMISIEVRAE